MAASSLVSSSEAEADLEPERMGFKLLLALPLAGRRNLLPLVLEPSSNLMLDVAERVVVGRGSRASRIVAPPGFVAIDTHVHTCFSPDSVADPAQMLRAAARRGLAGVAITDHNTVEGGHRAQAEARRLKSDGKLPTGFFVIQGEEVGSQQGHIIGLFLHTTVPPNLSAADTIAAIHAQGGLAIAAHPLHPSGVGRLAATLPFDAIETENMAENLHFSLSSSQADRKRAPFYASVKIPHLGVSDAHDPSVVGLGYTLIPGSTVDEAGVRQAMAAGTTEAMALVNTRRIARLGGGVIEHTSTGFGLIRRAFGFGGHLLRRLTGADQARLRPSFSHGGLGLSLFLGKRF